MSWLAWLLPPSWPLATNLCGLYTRILFGGFRGSDARKEYARKHPFTYAWKLIVGNGRKVGCFFGSLREAQRSEHLIRFFDILLIVETKPLLTGILVFALVCRYFYSNTQMRASCDATV